MEKVNNQIIIQFGAYWGNWSGRDNVSGEVYFPISFPIWPRAIVGTPNDFSDILILRDWGVSKCTWAIHDRYSDYSAYANFSWMAIGF